jgi:hypothetical protein
MIERQLRDWLYKFQYEIKDDPQPHAHFQMRARDAQGLVITIFQGRGEPFVTIISGMKLGNDDFGDRVRSVLADPKATAGDDLSIQLTLLGVEFIIEGTPPESVRIQHKVMFDASITDLRFIHDMMLVRRGLGLTQSVFHRAALPRA